MRRYPVLSLLALTFACAERGGATRIAAVNQQGGVLTSADGLFSLEIPQGALAKNVAVSITIRPETFTGSAASQLAASASPTPDRSGAATECRY
jgi:hypothetical protein